MPLPPHRFDLVEPLGESDSGRMPDFEQHHRDAQA
jgi:hypothetical protein